MSSAPKILILATILGNFMAPAVANTFLGSRRAESAAHPPLLEELETILGSEKRIATEARVARLEQAIRPIFQAMPKGQDGGLKPEAVRYTLHRLFVERHGWFVRGLDAVGEAWNSSSPSIIFKDSDEVGQLFEKRLGLHDFTLHQVAVMAAALESFVHTETLARLRSAYRLMDFSEDGVSTEDEIYSIIDTYMLMYILGTNHSTTTKAQVERQRRNINHMYPAWPQTQEWVRQVRREVLDVDGTPGDTSFFSTMKVLETLGDRYGSWQNRECQELKLTLMNLEDETNLNSKGRIPLETFYTSALGGNWQFSESISYLRQLGALDETDPEWPTIMIPNYINAPSNCVASSRFYLVCCINECEALLSHLEVEVGAPATTPAKVLELVSKLPSATEKAPRTLSMQLTQRLQEIAQQHGGKVPFHGRLFMQWMHHAYPRECPYPHLSGTTQPVSPEQWLRQTGTEAVAGKDAMQWHVQEAKQRTPRASEQEEHPWADDEELFVAHHATMNTTSAGKTWRAVTRGLMLLAAIFSVTLTLARTFLTGLDNVIDAPHHKYNI